MRLLGAFFFVWEEGLGAGVFWTLGVRHGLRMVWCGMVWQGRILHRRRFVSFIDSTVHIRTHTSVCADSRNPNTNSDNGIAAKHKNVVCFKPQ